MSGPIEDVTVLDGGWSSDAPCIILDAAFARKAIECGELPLFVHQALQALELSGKRVVMLSEAALPGTAAQTRAAE